jgi:hypothetical protein
VPLENPIDLRSGSLEKKEMRQIREEMQESITRVFAGSLPDILKGMVDLALGAEKEDVRLRASSRILDEVSDNRRNLQAPAGATIQILNAIPFERTAYIGKSEAKVVEVGDAKVALPVRKKIVPEGVSQKVKSQYMSGGKSPVSDSMSKIGPAVDNDPKPVKTKEPK